VGYSVEFMAPPMRGSSGFATAFEKAEKGVRVAQIEHIMFPKR